MAIVVFVMLVMFIKRTSTSAAPVRGLRARGHAKCPCACSASLKPCAAGAANSGTTPVEIAGIGQWRRATNTGAGISAGPLGLVTAVVQASTQTPMSAES